MHLEEQVYTLLELFFNQHLKKHQRIIDDKKIVYIVGFPRIGEQRELKRALESFWADKCLFDEVEEIASTLRKRHLRYQKDAGIEYISSNDFSFYDNMLDTCIMLNAIPNRFKNLKDEELYFSMARGNKDCVAMQMTKWFNTNYHYIVPELSLEDIYKLDASKIVNEYKEAKELGIKNKNQYYWSYNFFRPFKKS